MDVSRLREVLKNYIDVACNTIEAKQARIDELMLEYCPNEMTPEQICEYEKHQVVWHSGPPPSIGWWPVCHGRVSSKNLLSWWDGKQWSWMAIPSDNKELAGRCAAQPAKSQNLIRWN